MFEIILYKGTSILWMIFVKVIILSSILFLIILFAYIVDIFIKVYNDTSTEAVAKPQFS